MKKSHIIIYLISFLITIASYIYFITMFIEGEATLYLHSYHLVALGLIAVPMIIELIFKKELPYIVLVGYILFVLTAQIIGSAYQGYRDIYVLDLIVHAFSAFLVVVFVDYVWGKNVKDLTTLHRFIYFIGTAILVGVLWEIVEFLGDDWFGMNNQAFKRFGVELVGHDAISDTMIDLICDFVGAIIGSSYVELVGRQNEKNL